MDNNWKWTLLCGFCAIAGWVIITTQLSVTDTDENDIAGSPINCKEIVMQEAREDAVSDPGSGAREPDLIKKNCPAR